ncbi:hypothetical protein [Paraburkholderia sp. BL6665CI2N2]|uniref:hypothetical protein n=1 Tax=Paraburkholderia sp. BL6665CI2N2 TaxID=1938806 RepID=UPI00106639D3|nr:hypothetical protein [Paraburkholderia sp. BL6665CI2N2]
MAIAQMVGFFTAIGWATLILVRLPAAQNPRAGIDSFYALAFQGALTTLVCTLGAALVGVGLARFVHFDFWSFLSLLWGWTAYQIARHYFIAYKRYRTAIFFDGGLVLVSAAALVICRKVGISSSHALAIASLLVSLPMFAAVGAPSLKSIRLGIDAKGIQFGLTNFLSGGIPLVFVPTATVMCGAKFAGMLSLLASLSSVGMLLPRAISVTKLPELAARRSSGLALDGTLHAMRVSIARSNGLVSLINAAAVFVVALQKTPDPSMRWAAVIAGMLLTVLCAVGIMGLVNSNALAVFEKAASAASINVATTSLFVLLFAACAHLGGTHGFFLVLISAIAVTALRNELIRAGAKAACTDYRSSLHGGAEVVQ